MPYQYLTAFFIFSNIFFLTLSSYLGLDRPLFNLDYLLLIIIFYFSRNILSLTSLFVIFFVFFNIDVLLMVIQIFPFVRLTDILYLSNFIFNGPILYRLLLLFLVVLFFLQFFVLRDYFFKKIHLNIKQAMSIICCVLIALVVKNTFYPVKIKNVDNHFNRQIFNSQLWFFLKNQRTSFFGSLNQQTLLADSRYDAATKPLREQLIKHDLSHKILIIVNESWGATNKQEHQQAILKSIYQKQNKLEWIKQGDFNFIGTTVAGELRELCYKQPLSLDLKNGNRLEFQNCIPNQLKKLGYQTYAIHGAKSIMYERNDWYSKAGFQHLYFFEKLPNAGLCYAFEGRCDIKIPIYIKKMFANPEPTLVYWMTLNTHTPYNDKIFYDGLECTVLGVKQESESCKNYRLQYQFFTVLSQLIDDPVMKGVEVYVVGDHSPPIFDIKDNLFNFKGSNVAWLHFKIK